MTGLPVECETCGAPLRAGKIVPTCEECKTIQRAERLAAAIALRAEAEAQREARRRAIAARQLDPDPPHP
jgi:hypothetical protein